jgi:hypothetical protein
MGEAVAVFSLYVFLRLVESDLLAASPLFAGRQLSIWYRLREDGSSCEKENRPDARHFI